MVTFTGSPGFGGFPINPSAIYVILFGPKIIASTTSPLSANSVGQDGEACQFAGYFNLPDPSKTAINYAGAAAMATLGITCAYQFSPNFDLPLPNRDETLDFAIFTLSTALAITVVDPFNANNGPQGNIFELYWYRGIANSNGWEYHYVLNPSILGPEGLFTIPNGQEANLNISGNYFVSLATLGCTLTCSLCKAYGKTMLEPLLPILSRVPK